MLWGWHQSLAKGHGGIPAVPKGISAQLVFWPAFLTTMTRKLAYLCNKAIGQCCRRADALRRVEKHLSHLALLCRIHHVKQPVQITGHRHTIHLGASPNSLLQDVLTCTGTTTWAWLRLSREPSAHMRWVRLREEQRNRQLYWESAHRLQGVLENTSYNVLCN